MIGLPQSVKIHVCVGPTDMCKSFTGLCSLAEHVLEQDALSGHLFVFRNRLKVMYWDGDGLAIWCKRLEKGTVQLPTDLLLPDAQQAGAEITVGELNLLLGGIDLASAKQRRRYKRPNKPR